MLNSNIFAQNLFGDKVEDVSIDDALTAVSKGAAIAAAIYDENFEI